MNIGTGKGTSVNTIFEMLKKIIRYKWDAVHGPARLGDVYKICLDSSRAENELEWTAQVDLEEGLRRTVESFQKAGRGAR